MKIIELIKSIIKKNDPSDVICPACGYYCLGRGGIGCIDKTTLNKEGKYEMSDHIKRMKVEHKELDDKIKALNAFIHSNPIFNTLDDLEQARMIKQCAHMEAYASVLATRIWVAIGN